MYEYETEFKIRLYDDREETPFPTEHDLWLEVIPNGLEEGMMIKLNKKQFKDMKEFLDIEKE